MNEFNRHRVGMTLIELMVVIAIIGIVSSIISVAFVASQSSEEALKSRNHLRQIAQWMDQYASNHRDVVVPARFNYWDEESVSGVPNLNAAGGSRFHVGTSTTNNRLLTPNPFKLASDPEVEGALQGSWADAIWVDANLGASLNLDVPPVANAYTGNVYGNLGPTSVASPGWWLYERGNNRFANPLRSGAPNSNPYPMRFADGSLNMPSFENRGLSNESVDVEGRIQGLPTPIGGGAWEEGMPGFFAANAFFDARSQSDIDGDSSSPTMDRFVTHAQIRAPARSIFLVDSFRGETIGESPLAEEADYQARTRSAWWCDLPREGLASASYRLDNLETHSTQEVDFRYGGTCLMLHLDGSIHSQDPWFNYEDLVGSPGEAIGRNVRIMDLDRRLSTPSLGPNP